MSVPVATILPMIASAVGRIASGPDAGAPPKGGDDFAGMLDAALGGKAGEAVSGLVADLTDAKGDEPLALLAEKLQALLAGKGQDGDDPLAGLLAAFPHLQQALNAAAADLAAGTTGALQPLADSLDALSDALRALDPELAGQLGALADRISGDAPDEALMQRLAALAKAAATGAVDTAAPTLPTSASLLEKPEDKGFRKAEGLAPPTPPPAQADGTSLPREGRTAPDRPGGDRQAGAAAALGTEAASAIDAAASDGAADGPQGFQQMLSQHLRGEAGIAARPGQGAYPAALGQLAVPQVAFEIARQVQAGQSRFQIRLDPPELGRIDVRLDIDSAGHVNARLSVEKAETLDLLQRDQRTLERALAQAGLEGSRTSLEFSLKGGNGGFAGEQSRQGFGAGGPNGRGEPEDPVLPAAAAITLYRGTASPGGVDRLA